MKNLNTIIVLIALLFISCKKENSKKTSVEVEPVKPFTAMSPKPDTDNGGLFLPDGFGALVVAESVGPSRHLAVNDNGDIYVKLSLETGRNGNIALRDTNNDGKADVFQPFGDYPNDGSFATEMRIHNGYLYFSSELKVYRQKLTPNKLIPDDKPEIIVVDPYPIRWHNAKSLAFDNKGSLYVTFSAPTNACEDAGLTGSDPNAIVRGENPCSQLDILGGIWKFDENTLEQSPLNISRFATGIRSVVAISWNEEDNSLYAVQHGRDYLYNHAPQYFSQWKNAVLPAEELIKISEGDNYGWPYTYYDQFKHKRMMAPEYGGDGNKEAKGFTDPLMGLPAHWAPNDMLFYKGKQFPEHYKKGVFIAFHGSTNCAPYPQTGYIVAFVPFENGKPTDKWEVFADGFTGTDIVTIMEDAKYRPMGLAEGPDGSLYISESKTGKIWRIMFNGNAKTFGREQLENMEKLKSKSYLKIPDEKADNLSLR